MKEKSVIEKSDLQFNKMTKTPVSKLIILLALPTALSTMITTIYNLTDSLFVGGIAVEAGGATSVVFVLMAMLQALGFMFGHGTGSFVSTSLGRRDNDSANRYASTGFLCSIVAGLLITILGLIFIQPFMRFLGSTETILPYAVDYAFYILIAAPFMTASCVLNNILRYEGRANLAMIGLTIGGLVNVGLTPLFVFTANMGIAGAGLATGISQVVSFIVLGVMFLMGKTQSKISFNYISKKFSVYKNIVITGFPTLARQGLTSVSAMIVTLQVASLGDGTIVAMGCVTRIANMVFSIGLGIGQGLQPVAAFNNGAEKYSRVKKGGYFALYFGLIFIGTVSAICFALAPQIISIFRGEAEIISIGAHALRMYCIALLFIPIPIAVTMLFQSVGKSILALVLSCLQSGLLFIPLCYILPNIMGIVGVEISQIIAYVVSAVISLPFMIVYLKKLPKDNE